MAQRVLTEVIAALRAQDRTTRWLATRIGMEPSRVWRIVQGQRPMPDDFPARVAEQLHVAENVLFPTEKAS